MLAAAASPVLTTRSVSPELALVDAALAAELRLALAAPAEDAPAPEHDPVALDVVETDGPTPAEALYRALESPAHVDASDLIVDTTEHRVGVPDVVATVEAPTPSLPGELEAAELVVGALEDDDTPSGVSQYPALPAPADAGPDPMDAAEAALRDIRERLTTPPQVTRRRRFRMRFTVASGASTVCALGLLATDVFFGVAQLPL